MAGIAEEIFRISGDTANAIKELQQLKGTYKELTDEQVKQVTELKVLEEAERRLLAQRTKTNNPTTYIQLTKKIEETQNKVVGLNNALEGVTKTNKNAKLEVDALGVSLTNAFKGTQVNAVKAAAGQFNALNNSVNQVARELPAFAVSANIGFLAISNNLPILFDALAKVNAENRELEKSGGKGVSAFKQLGASLLSFNTLLTIGVTLLTVYGGKIFEAISGAFKSAEAFKLQADALKILDDQIQESIKSQEDLVLATANVNKQIIKDRGLVSEAEGKFLDVVDKNNDKYLAIERKRRDAISQAVQAQLQGGDKTLAITTSVANGVISIEDKKNNKIIRLDKDAKNVLGAYSGFFRKTLFTQEEQAFNDKLAAINKQNARELNELRNLNTAEMEQVALSELDKQKLRRHFSDEEFIRQRSAQEQIKQLQIESISDEKERDIEMAIFQTQKAFDEIDRNNKAEKQKLRIARINRAERIEIEKIQTKDALQLAENLKNIEENYQKEVKRIKAENIPEKEQFALREALALELAKKLQDIDVKFSKETGEKIKADFETTLKSRRQIVDDNTDFEIFQLEFQLRQEEKLHKFFGDKEIKRLKAEILQKKIDRIQAHADEQAALTTNEAEKLAIQNRANIEIKKLRMKDEEESKESNKKKLANAVNYLADLIKAIVDATRQIIDIKIKETDALISQQQKRVDAAKNIADQGNAELLELEQKRLDDLTKKREKYVRDQQALAAVELVANTAIAVSKAAAQGGVAAGVTIAAALIALVAGLATARSIASQAAYYDGGFTGHGSPTDESNTIGGRQASRSYVWHKEEFVVDHKKTRENRDILEDFHAGHINLRDWQRKVGEYDQMVTYKSFKTGSPIYAPSHVQNNINLKSLESRMDEMNRNIKMIKFGLNVDEKGFTKFQQGVINRMNYIDKLGTY